MDIEALQHRLRQFAAERDWQPFHTPKNLAMALMVEAAELAELFQWQTPEQSRAAKGDLALQRRVGDELADVMLYLVQLADHCGVRLERAVPAKLQANARKHPALRAGAPAAQPALPPRPTHVLLDYENVQPDDDALRALVPGVTDLWLFHGPHQKKVGSLFQSFGERVTRVPISRVGKNSLDFHLSFYVGYIAAMNPDARLVVLANDQGYAPMLEHAATLGFEAALVGHARAGRPAARGVARKAGKTSGAASGKTTRTASGKTAGKRAAAARPATPARAAAAPEKVSAALNDLPKAVAKRPPRKTAAAKRAAAATAAEKAATLTERRGSEDARHRTTRRSGAAQRADAGRDAATPPATTSAGVAPESVPASARRGSAKTANRTKNAPPARKVAAAPTPTAAPKPAAKPPAASGRAPASAARRGSAMLNKLSEQLLRLGDARPKRQAPLRRLVQSLLGPQADAAAVQAALDALAASGQLAIDGKGAVSYRLPATST